MKIYITTSDGSEVARTLEAHSDSIKAIEEARAFIAEHDREELELTDNTYESGSHTEGTDRGLIYHGRVDGPDFWVEVAVYERDVR